MAQGVEIIEHISGLKKPAPNDTEIIDVAIIGAGAAGLNASLAAQEKGMRVIGLTGRSGGLLAGMVDQEIRVKGRKHSDRIQEVHIKILHILVLLIEKGIK